MTNLIQELFDSNQIVAAISPQNLNVLTQLEIFDTIESTNTYLLTHAKSGLSGRVCLAEEQTKGRGRLGRQWFSPYGTNIYCSLLWRFSTKIDDMSGLGIVVAVILANTFKKYGIAGGIQLKWPNDILFAGRKLAGILLERVGDAVVIGMGVNLSLPASAETGWIALTEITGRPISRNYIVGLLLNELLEKLPVYETRGLSAFTSTWRQQDFLIGKNITVHMPIQNKKGVMQGINEQGELLLQEERGTLLQFRYGEVSVRL